MDEGLLYYELLTSTLGPAAENKPFFTWEGVQPAGRENIDSPDVTIDPRMAIITSGEACMIQCSPV